MKWTKKYKDYYEYYADKLPLPALLIVVFIAICVVGFIVYALLN